MSNQPKGSDPEAGGEKTAFLSKLCSSLQPERACQSNSAKGECSFVHPSILNPSLTDAEYEMVKGWDLDMTGHAEKCVERYCQLTGASPKDFKKVATPCMDDHPEAGGEAALVALKTDHGWNFSPVRI